MVCNFTTKLHIKLYQIKGFLVHLYVMATVFLAAANFKKPTYIKILCKISHDLVSKYIILRLNLETMSEMLLMITHDLETHSKRCISYASEFVSYVCTHFIKRCNLHIDELVPYKRLSKDYCKSCIQNKVVQPNIQSYVCQGYKLRAFYCSQIQV